MGIKDPSVATQLAVARERELNEIIARWDGGERADALAALRAAPHLAASRSAVVVLAYEEYCQRQESGECVVVEDFIGNFSQHQTAVRRVLWFHNLDQGNPKLPKRLELGKGVGQYELVDWLGRGSFSHVYLACDTSLAGRAVVLKVTTMPGLEPEALATVDSPYVVSVYAAPKEEDDGLTTIVMPFFGSATFEDLLERLRTTPRPRGQLIFDVAATPAALDPRLPPATMPTEYARRPFLEGAVWLLRGIAEGLSKAHASGYLHLDLKPSNILLAAGACPMLADFNLSQRSDDLEKAVGGTVPYMAPEQLRRFVHQKGIDVDAAADVYAFGVIAHELLTGEHPYGPIDKETSPQELAGTLLEKLKVARRRPIAARKMNPSLRRLIDACLSIDPKLRPTSEALRSRLTRELGPAARLVRRIIRRPLASSLAAVVLAGALAGGLFELSRLPSAIQKAENAFAHGDLVVATMLVNEILKAEPEHFGAAVLKARIAIEDRLYAEAARLLKPLVEATQDIKLKSLYGYACALARERTTAIEVFESMYEAKDRTTANVNNLVWALTASGEYERARFYLEDSGLCDSDVREVAYNFAILEEIKAQSNPNYNPIRGLTAAIKVDDPKDPRGGLSFLIARLRVYVSRFSPQNEEDILADLRRARENGILNKTLTLDHLFEPYWTHPGFRELADIKGDPSRRAPAVLIRP